MSDHERECEHELHRLAQELGLPDDGPQENVDGALSRIRELEGRINRADRYLALGSPNGAREALAPPDSEPGEGVSEDRFSHWVESHGDIGTFYVRPEGFKVWPRKGPGLDGLWAVFVPKSLYTESDAPIVTVNYGSAEEAMAAVDHNWPGKDDEPAEGEGDGGIPETIDLSKRDQRPQRYGWAPGYYENTCQICGKQFVGDKWAWNCAPCAYADDTAQRQDAGDALRAKLSDPEAMQRVTERAAERQDAMLERREAMEALDALHLDATDGGFQPLAHADEQKEIIRHYLDRTSDEGTGYNEVAGEVYQAVGVLLSDAGRFDDPDGIALLDACSYLAGNRDNPPDSLLPFESKGTGCVVPEAVKVLPDFFDEVARRIKPNIPEDDPFGDGVGEGYRECASVLRHKLDRAIAEQGGQRVPDVDEHKAIMSALSGTTMPQSNANGRVLLHRLHKEGYQIVASAPQPEQEGEGDE